MTSQEDQNLFKLLSTISSQLKLYFSYCAPWLSICFSIVAIMALVLRKRREKNLVIYLFAWQYAFSILFCLNMAFNDPDFSKMLFGFTLNIYVSDPVCKMSNMFLRFFYCASSWMQVVI